MGGGLMDVAKWGRICERNGFKLMEPVTTRHGRVLIAERHFLHHREFPRPHVQAIWTFERDGIEIAQKLFFEWAGSTPRMRANAAAREAEQWAKDNLEIGRYKH